MGAESRAKTQEENATRDSGILVEDAPVIRTAFLKKLKSNKSNKKKWFVLTGTTPSNPARLEYYDNERKWKSKAAPKRSIILEKCFNINRKLDTRDSRNKFVIALYTLDDCVSIVFDTEMELNDWLDQLLTLQQGRFGNIDGRRPMPNYEHVFTVTVKNFTPEENNFTPVNHLLGQQRLCVTTNSVMFFPVGSENSVDFPHVCIRSFANNDRHFKMDTGRNSPTGSGSLLIDCVDKDVTHHLHETIHRAMSSSQSKELYLPRNSRNRSHSLSENQRLGNSQNFPPKSLPRAVERNRTISEPPDKPGQVTPEPGLPPKRPYSMRYGGGSYSTSPNIKSPISPVGSMSTGISSDGTGSSNSINDPYIVNGDHDMVNYISNQPDVIPEESSGEISIEFNPKQESHPSGPSINQTLPRAGPSQSKYVHQKQASLTEFTMDDYMDMSIGSTSSKTTSHPGPPLPKRNNEDSMTSSLSSSSKLTSGLTSPATPLPHRPSDTGAGSSYGSEAGDYHAMSRLQPAAEGAYYDMERLGQDLDSSVIADQDLQVTSTPLKSTSTVTLVQSECSDHSLPGPRDTASSPSSRTPPVDIFSRRSLEGSEAPCTVLTPPEADHDQVDSVRVSAKVRVPSGDGGYVDMSPGVSHNLGALEEQSSLAILEESLEGGGHWRNSPRHHSPSFMKERSRPDSKRNSSCYDDSETHWEPWRYEEAPVTGDTDNYAMIYYPGSRNTQGSGARPTPHSRLSPSSSSSAMSGTPSSDSRFTDFHDRLHQFSSFIRDDDDDGTSGASGGRAVTSRPPPVTPGSASSRRSLSTTTPKHIPSTSSNNSSRSNISPFGKTPPSLLAGSPTILSRLDGFFRHRAGSVPSRPPVERRRHRTQSEGEKDAAQNP